MGGGCWGGGCPCPTAEWGWGWGRCLSPFSTSQAWPPWAAPLQLAGSPSTAPPLPCCPPGLPCTPLPAWCPEPRGAPRCPRSTPARQSPSPISAHQGGPGSEGPRWCGAGGNTPSIAWRAAPLRHPEPSAGGVRARAGAGDRWATVSAAWATLGLSPPNRDSPSAPGSSAPPGSGGGACPARLCRGCAGAARRVDRRTASCCLLCRVPTAAPHTHHPAGCVPWAPLPWHPQTHPPGPAAPSPLPHPSPALLPVPAAARTPAARRGAPAAQRGVGHPRASCPALPGHRPLAQRLLGTGAPVTALGCPRGQAAGPSASGTPAARCGVCHHPQSSVPVPAPGTRRGGGWCPCPAATSPGQHR